MKTSFLNARLVLAATLATITPLSMSAEEATNLLYLHNPGFEETDDGQSPIGWRTWHSEQNDTANFLWEALDHPPEGKWAIGLSNGVRGLTQTWIQTLPVPIEPGHRYILSFYALADSSRGAKREVKVHWSPTDQLLTYDCTEIFPIEPGDGEWTKHRYQLQAPEGRTGLTLGFQQIGSSDGKIYFDDVRLEGAE